MSTARAELDALHAIVNTGSCPVCNKQCGKKDPRHAVLNHLRKSKEVAHVVWKGKYYAKLFPHGKFCNHPADEDVMLEELVKQLERAYGPHIIQTLVTQKTSINAV